MYRVLSFICWEFASELSVASGFQIFCGPPIHALRVPGGQVWTFLSQNAASY